VRKIQVVKMRGQAQKLGVHTFRISDDGLEIFPRAVLKANTTGRIGEASDQRVSLGIPAIDQMMGGGLPVGYSLLVVGPSGSGKTVLATQFLAEGVRIGEPGVVAQFEKSSNQLMSRTLNALIAGGDVGVINTRTLDLSLDEILHDLVAMIVRLKARRVVIDSLSGFEMALAAVFREDFRESLYRLVATLTDMGVTVLMTMEMEDRYTELRFSPHGNAFLADAIIMQRYIEIQGKLRRVLSVVKVRGSAHSEDIHVYGINADGIAVGDSLDQFQGILTGRPLATASGLPGADLATVE
jgi:circadian clock protein KaiC